MTLRALPCPATESLGVRTLRLAASMVAVFASLLVAGISLVNLASFYQDAHRAASLLFVLTSLLLLVSSFASLRQPRRVVVFSCVAATALALGFTDLGRGSSGFTITQSGVTHYAAVANLLMLLIGAVLLCVQIAALLVRRHGCNCG